LIKWPGVIKPGTVFNGIGAHEDMIPTLMAAIGEPDVVEKLKKGYQVGDETYKVHLDGYNLQSYLKGDADASPRKEFLYWNDDGSLVALRYDRWKIVFAEQRGHGFDVWQEPFQPLRLPKLFCLRSDPLERADHEAIGYPKWRIEHVYVLVPAQGYVGRWLQSFKEFPPRQKPGTFSIDQVMEKLQEGAGGGNK